MKLNRRAFLSLSAISSAAIFENSWSKSPLEFLESSKLSILQGATSATSTEFSIVYWDTLNITAEVSSVNSPPILATWSRTVSRPDSGWSILKLYFDNLNLGEVYQLVIKDKDGNVVDIRNFKTLDLNNPEPRIAIVSCMNDYLHRRRLWQSLVDKKPDVIYFVGDSVYADHPSRIEWKAADPKQLWERFTESRNKLSIYKASDLIPILAVWDDHDFGSNNSNRHYPYASESKQNFLDFFAQSDSHPALEKGPGVAMKFKAFGKSFYFLDGRSYRSSEDDHIETVFGREQEDWLLSQLQIETQPSWLITGSQWFGAYFEKEAYEYTHPNSFKNFLNLLRNTEARVQFVSGDIHFSELMAIEVDVLGYETLEITSSSMHSLTFPGWHLIKRNPRRLRASSGHNFTVVKFERDLDFTSTIECVGANSKIHYDLRYP